MPVTRNTRLKSRSTSPCAAAPAVSGPTVIKYKYRRVPGGEFGAPFKPNYEAGLDSRFDETPNPSVQMPTNPRPPPLSLTGLECIRTLGQGQGQVLMVSSKTRTQYQGNGAVFALKAIPRKMYRTHAVTLAGSDSETDPDKLDEIAQDHMYTKDLERGNLVSLAWNPFVAGILQTFDDPRMLYFALEFIPGGILRSLIQKANAEKKKGKLGLGLRNANFYFANIVCALDFLHKNGIVHRDVKPENILVGADGYLCLTDFGSSIRFENIDGQWQDVGTTFYMAPECTLMSPYNAYEVPAALDWWSSGCILYEMITGELPFCEAHTLATQLKSARGFEAIQSPSNFCNMESLIKQLFELNPEERLGGNGKDVKKHPWLSKIDWQKMERRAYMAPLLPESVDISELWHDTPLPKQHYVPGLKVIEPPIHLAHDNRFPERPIL